MHYINQFSNRLGIPIGIPIRQENISQYLAIILLYFINIIIVIASDIALLQMTENQSHAIGR